jgi:hypothetical protein
MYDAAEGLGPVVGDREKSLLPSGFVFDTKSPQCELMARKKPEKRRAAFAPPATDLGQGLYRGYK